MPSGYKDHKTAFQIVFYTFWLLPISISPILLDLISINSSLDLSYIGGGVVLVFGLVFLYLAFQLLKTKRNVDAKKIMIWSLVYLPVIQIIYIIDKYI